MSAFSTLQQCLFAAGFAPARGRTVYLGLLLAALLVQANARVTEASCGDYLLHSGMYHDGVYDRQLPPNTLKELTSPVAGVETPSQPAPESPCRGPGCRQAPAPSAPVPTPTQIRVNSETAVLLSHVPVSLEQSLPLLVQGQVRALAGYPASILRPPMAG